MGRGRQAGRAVLHRPRTAGASERRPKTRPAGGPSQGRSHAICYHLVWTGGGGGGGVRGVAVGATAGVIIPRVGVGLRGWSALKRIADGVRRASATLRQRFNSCLLYTSDAADEEDS